MNIFEKRPLGLILCVALSGFSIFALSSPLIRLIALSLAMVLFILTQAVPKFRKSKLTLCAVTLFFALFCSFIYFDFIFYPNNYYNEQYDMKAEIINVEKESKYQALDLKLKYIDDKKCGYKIKLYLYDTEKCLLPGDIVEFTAELEKFDDNGDFDFKAYYTARGFSATAFAAEIEVIDSDSPPLSYRFKEMRIAICEKVEAVSNKSAAALFGAGLLGERELISGQVKLDFQRIGIAHVLALSGMHMALLVGFIDIILIALRLGKKSRICIECIFAFAYMAFTGFPLSVCRAGIMFIVSSVLYLLSGCKDSVTSLFIAAVLIVLVIPYSAVDIGFWLSIVATLGILMASELVNDKYNDRIGIKRFLHSVLVSLVFSLFAVASTSAISSFSFRSISVISIISTLIFSFLIEFYIYYGIAVWIFGNIIPLGSFLVSYEELIKNLAAFFSDLSNICASTSFLTVKLLFLVFTVAFALLTFFIRKNKRLLICTIAFIFVFISTVSLVITGLSRYDDKILYVGEASDRILIKSDGKVALVDISFHEKSEGYFNNSVIFDEGLVELDSYIVLNYSEYLVESVPILVSNVMVREIKLPMPTNNDEEQIAIELFRELDDYRVQISFYEEKSIITISDCEICIPFRDVEKNCLALTLKTDGKIYSYLSSGILEKIPQSEELLYVSSATIFGYWGCGYSSTFMVDEFAERLDKVLINDEAVYFDVNCVSQKITDVQFFKNEFVIYD